MSIKVELNFDKRYKAMASMERKPQPMPDRTPRYRIRTAAQLSGVMPATIRAWERRYGIPNPERSESKHRLFSDHDIYQIRSLKEMSEQGMAPQQAAAEILKGAARVIEASHEALGGLRATLSGARVSVEATQALLRQHRESHQAWGSAVARILDATERFSPEGVEAAVQEAMLLGSGMQIFTEVFRPALTQIGEAWHEGRFSVAQEHMASEIIGNATRELLRLMQPLEPRRHAVLVCFAGEYHVIPLYGAAFELVRRGMHVTVLGTGLLPEHLLDAVAHLEPDLVGLSLTHSIPPDKALATLRGYQLAVGDRLWVVGGRGAAALTAEIAAVGAIWARQDWSEIWPELAPRLGLEA